LICAMKGITSDIGVGVGATEDPNIGDFYDLGLWVVGEDWTLTHFGHMEPWFMRS